MFYSNVMLRISLVAVAVVATVLVMSGVVSVSVHPDKITELTNSVTTIVTNQDRLLGVQKILNNLKQQGGQLFAKAKNSTSQTSVTPTPEVAGARDIKTSPSPKKASQIELKTTIPLSF